MTGGSPTNVQLQRLMEPQHLFQGNLVHVLQIGLGTNNTFLDDTCWGTAFFVNASSHEPGEQLRGIGVDPLEECVLPLRSVAKKKKMDQISMVLGSVGEFAGLGTVFCVPGNIRTAIQAEMDERSVEPSVREEVEREIMFLENMSSMDAPLPEFDFYVDYIRCLSGIGVSMLEQRAVHRHTFQDILKMHQAGGCQVLLVDAEGSDCAILRSMMHTCKRGEMPWPWVIHFETCGHCDTKEHDKVEEQTVMDLQKEGYLLVYAGRDSTLLHEPALHAERGLPLWADEHFTLRCDACGWLAWPSHPGFKEQAGTGFGHWQGLEQCSRRWRCNLCCKWLPEPKFRDWYGSRAEEEWHNAEWRFANDGRAYKRSEFISWYGAERGLGEWDFAARQELGGDRSPGRKVG